MPYIHENIDWPNFTWDSDILAPLLASLRYREGLLVGQMRSLGFSLQQEANLKSLTEDVIRSSAIEGATLNQNEVRSSIARRLGMDIGGLITASCDVEGVVEMMLDATQNYSEPLTIERLLNWHAALFPTGRSGMKKITVAAWRTMETGPMQVVSGPIGKEKVHFEAPTADKLESEMEQFINWFNGPEKTDPVLKAGIAHLWFVTIHPFEDGNGRIARAIADMALAQADCSKERFYSMSSQIKMERKLYYDHLERQQHTELNITVWLQWFFDCLTRSFDRAETTLGAVLYKAALWQIANRLPINERQRLVINRMLEEDWQGHINTSKYAKLTKCSKDSALRDIRELLSGGILIQNLAGGRSTSYRLTNSEELD